jgi:hypothetical protein
MKKLGKIQIIKLLYNLYSLFKIWKGVGMKKLLTLGIMVLLALSVMPMILAVDLGNGIGIDITVEDFPPQIWLGGIVPTDARQICNRHHHPSIHNCALPGYRPAHRGQCLL